MPTGGSGPPSSRECRLKHRLEPSCHRDQLNTVDCVGSAGKPRWRPSRCVNKCVAGWPGSTCPWLGFLHHDQPFFSPPPRRAPWSAARTAFRRVTPTSTSPFCVFFLCLAWTLVHIVLMHAPSHWVGCERIVARRVLDLGDETPESLPSQHALAKPFVVPSSHDVVETILVCTLRLPSRFLRP